jgi:nitrite reductase/ring-hydroxylating ferredoxin subunit
VTFTENLSEFTAASTSIASASTAPEATRFVQYPVSWYPLCRSSDLRAGDTVPKRMKVLGTELVAFRASNGKPVVMNALCSHLGADLGGGCVKKDTIECPYHGWKYDQSGACVEIPGQSAIPEKLQAFAKQTSYPTEERHGLIFFFNGTKPLFELPFFFGEDWTKFISGKPFFINLPCSWYMMGSHAFDQRHLELVHSRRLSAPLQVDYPHPYGRRGSHVSAVEGHNIFDRLIRLLAGDKVAISMTPIGGTFVLVTGDFKKVKSRFFLMGVPKEDGSTDLHGLVFARKSGHFLVDHFLAPMSLSIRRWFTKGYLVNEVAELGSHVYRPHMLAAHDQALIDYYRWTADTTAEAHKNAGL